MHRPINSNTEFNISVSSIRYIEGGIRQSHKGYTIVNRDRLSPFELFIFEQGTLHIEVNGWKGAISPGTVQLHPPGIRQTGYRPSPDPVRFTWIHFEGIQTETSQNCVKCGRNGHNETVLSVPFCHRPGSFTDIVTLSHLLVDRRNAYQLEKNALLTALLARISFSAYQTQDAPAIFEWGLDDIKSWIQGCTRNPGTVEKLTPSYVAEHFRQSYDHIRKIFKQKTGRTLREYIIEQKMAYAKDLLENGYSIKETAHLTGYHYREHFTRQIRKYLGTTPSRLTKRRRDT